MLIETSSLWSYQSSYGCMQCILIEPGVIIWKNSVKFTLELWNMSFQNWRLYEGANIRPGRFHCGAVRPMTSGVHVREDAHGHWAVAIQRGVRLFKYCWLGEWVRTRERTSSMSPFTVSSSQEIAWSANKARPRRSDCYAMQFLLEMLTSEQRSSSWICRFTP